MRNIFALLAAFITSSVSAQVVSGLYSGTLVNDSTKKEQRYELALSEYRGKITGYSYTTFVVNDTFYYGVKRVKATKKGDKLIVEDDKMIANYFPESPAKGVKQINTIQLTGEDTLKSANGTWETTRTKIYYALHGGVEMQLNNDSSRSALIGHLKELNIIAQPHYADVETNVKVKEDKVKIETKEKKIKASEGKPQTGIVQKEPAAIPYTQRTNKVLQEFNASSDSLVLAFYDNGVIDGDSISVYVNGENIISNTKLLATATRKTIKLPNVETVEIILVAENLGTLPPNTGLLVVKDGDKTYQVNFSADLQTNAAIIFKRKLK
jgi:hypothetical protein